MAPTVVTRKSSLKPRPATTPTSGRPGRPGKSAGAPFIRVTRPPGKGATTKKDTNTALLRRSSILLARKGSIMPREDMDSFEPKTKVITAADKLDLTEEELEKTIDRVLEANNPNAPPNLVEYSYREETFKALPAVEQTEFHFSENGIMIRKESEEARARLDEQPQHDSSMDSGEDKRDSDNKNRFNYSYRETRTPMSSVPLNWSRLSKDKTTRTEPPPVIEFSATATRWEIHDSYIRFFERRKRRRREAAAKERSKKKKPGDAAAKDGGANASGKAETAEAAPLVGESAAPSRGVFKTVNDILDMGKFAKSAKIMERIMNRNSYEDIISDFKFWDDEADKYRDLGSLLPLWRFEAPSSEVISMIRSSGAEDSGADGAGGDEEEYAADATRASANGAPKKRRPALQVTGLAWNETYPDLLAVGYGSYDFKKRGAGVVCLYSLKNPSFHEYAFPTESGVMSLDFHPKHPSLLCVGLYDGTVLIRDVRRDKPIIRSTVRTSKHTDVVWRVMWRREAYASNVLSFFSVSGDGRITNWTVSKNELRSADIMLLKRADIVDGGGIDARSTTPRRPMSSSSTASTATLVKESSPHEFIATLASGTCMDFNKKNDRMFIIGTEEGEIHLCSKAYNSRYLHTYKAHTMPVYAVRWNYYHHNVFLSASADWTVKLWDINYDRPLMSFDLGSSVGDVAWSPYSSTVFAAVTDKGYVHVFDLTINKHESLTHHRLIVKKAKLTHVAFNPSEPIVVVGDDKGCVRTLKLSPNLRRKGAADDKDASKKKLAGSSAAAASQASAAAASAAAAAAAPADPAAPAGGAGAEGRRSGNAAAEAAALLEEERRLLREAEVKKLQVILDIVIKNM